MIDNNDKLLAMLWSQLTVSLLNYISHWCLLLCVLQWRSCMFDVENNIVERLCPMWIDRQCTQIIINQVTSIDIYSYLLIAIVNHRENMEAIIGLFW